MGNSVPESTTEQSVTSPRSTRADLITFNYKSDLITSFGLHTQVAYDTEDRFQSSTTSTIKVVNSEACLHTLKLTRTLMLFSFFPSGAVVSLTARCPIYTSPTIVNVPLWFLFPRRGTCAGAAPVSQRGGHTPPCADPCADPSASMCSCTDSP